MHTMQLAVHHHRIVPSSSCAVSTGSTSFNMAGICALDPSNEEALGGWLVYHDLSNIHFKQTYQFAIESNDIQCLVSLVMAQEIDLPFYGKKQTTMNPSNRERIFWD